VTRYFFFNDAWVHNEMDARARGIVREGWDKTPIETQVQGGKARKVRKDSALGFEGRDLHMNGDRVTVVGEVPQANGDIDLYVQSERGGIYRQRWEKTGDGRHEAAGKPRRTWSF
jgi:hypothetical protein